jgi:hypothetical protein
VNGLNATASLIAVGGTLAGVLLSVLTQAWLAHIARREAHVAREEARVEARRDNALAVVTALAKALDDHRSAMWKLGDRQLRQTDQTIIDEAEDASRDSRSAISIPLTTVEILVPELAPIAHEATHATFDMREPADLVALEELRADAKAAHQRLVNAARDIFSDMRVTV